MKKIILFIGLILIAFSAEAENAQRNENRTVLYSAEGVTGPIISVNRYGDQLCSAVDPSSGLSQSVVPVSNNGVLLNGSPAALFGWYDVGTDLAETSSTTTVINATSHAAKVGDLIQMYAGTPSGETTVVSAVTVNTITVSPAFSAAPANGNGFYIKRPSGLSTGSPITSSGTGLISIIDSGYKVGASFATNILKLEDAAHASGDAGIASWGIRNESPATFADGNGDYSPLSVNRYGTLNVQFAYNGATSTGGATTDIPYIPEDVAVGAGQVVMLAGARVKGDFNASAADLDAATINVDLDGRLATNPWGADTSETGQSCGTATASTADVSIKAAIVSTRIYVGSVTCASSDADNATNINFKDGSTVVAVGGVNQMATTSAGTFTAEFNPPLRGTANTAFNFNTAVSTSSVICCASWYTSGN
jgi:hypothetical protein